MKKSFIDRIFPHSSGALLPQHEQTVPLTKRLSKSPTSPPRIRMQENVSSSVLGNLERTVPFLSSSNLSASLKSNQNESQPAQLSASVLHHDDPFLPIERAARALQDSIQSLLDAQSYALCGRASGVEQDETMSGGSLTPTQSIATPRSSMGRGAVPIRQPAKKRPTLRGARKGLSQKMQQFAELRKEELQTINTEVQARLGALERVDELETRKAACLAEIDGIRQADTSSTAMNLRAEARNVESEIEELEHKLLELRVRHRHLTDQADQLQSTQESKISSFQGTVAMIDREARDFLRRPPISHALVNSSATESTGMYALKPDRRTLKMARDEWTAEQEILIQRGVDVEREHIALLEGERIWSEVAQRVNDFEHSLRLQTQQLTGQASEDAHGSMDVVLNQLNQVIDSLESSLSLAESKNWNLLVCAIGAELEAFHQAREMLEDTQHIANESQDKATGDRALMAELQLPKNVEAERASSSPHGSVGSNQSLQATLSEFSNIPATKYESEDDEPPADFFLSH